MGYLVRPRVVIENPLITLLYFIVVVCQIVEPLVCHVFPMLLFYNILPGFVELLTPFPGNIFCNLILLSLQKVAFLELSNVFLLAQLGGHVAVPVAIAITYWAHRLVVLAQVRCMRVGGGFRSQSWHR